jgi:hypothetical protein
VFLENRHLIDAATDYFQQGFDPSPVQHYWSLSVEEQFYLLWPALLLLVVLRRGGSWLRRVAVTAGAITAISLAWSVHLASSSPAAGYFSAPGRAFELGAGALAACWAFRAPRGLGRGGAWVLGPAGVALLLAALVVVSPGDPYPGVRGLLPTVGTALVLLAGLSGGPVAAVLSLRPMRFLGRISYSLYLWHWPAVVLVEERLPTGWGKPVRVLVLLAGIVLVSTASYLFVERPFLRYAPPRHARAADHVPVRRPAWALVLAVGLVVGTTASLLPSAPRSRAADVAPGDVARPGALAGLAELTAYDRSFQRIVDVEVSRQRVPANLSPSLPALAARHAFQPSLCHVSPCSAGSGPRHAVILGDSFAQVTSPLLTGALDLRQWTVTLRWKSHCVIALPDECPGLYDLGPGRVDLLVLSDYIRPGETAPLGDSLRRSLERLARGTGHLVYVGQPPGMRKALVDCVSGGFRLRSSCYRAPSQSAEVNRLKRDAVTRAGGTFVDPTPWLCGPDRCAVVVRSRPVYVDTTHLEAGFAALLAPLFRKSLLEAHIL